MSAQGQQYSRDDIYQAIRNADKAGDTAAVQRLSGYLATMDNPSPAATPSAPSDGQYQGLGRLPAMAGLALARGTARLAGLPGDVQAGVNWAGNKLHDLAFGPSDSNTQAHIDDVQKASRFPTSGELVDHLGLAPHALTPTTPLERYGSAGIEAIPATAAAIASGGTAVPAIASSEAGAMAGQAAHDFAPDSAWAPVVAGLVGGLGANGIVNKVENFLTGRTVTKAASDAADRLAQAQADRKAALDAAPQANFDIGRDAQSLKNVSKADYAATRAQLDSDLANHHAAHDAAIEQVAAQHGTSSTLQDAGEALQQHARDWISNVLPAKVKALWAPVDAAIPAESTTDLNPVGIALENMTKQGGVLAPMVNAMGPKGVPMLQKLFSSIKDGQELAGGTPGVVPWKDAQTFRSKLGEFLADPQVIKDIGAKNLDAIYAITTDAMRKTAAANGAADVFDAANGGTRQLYQIGEGPMSKLVAGARASAEDPTPEAAASALLNGAKKGGTDLAILRQEIPQGINELGAAHLRLNPGGFAKLPPESQSALLSEPDAGATVVASQMAKDAASAAQKQGYKTAQQIHQSNLEQIAAATGDKKLAQTLSLRSSKNALDEAKAQHQAAMAELAKHSSAKDASNSSILGAIIGEPMGIAADHFLHLGGLGALSGPIAGAAVPRLVRGGVNALVPNTAAGVAYPALGALAGSNALSVPPPQEGAR